jgi:hypothetical protein
LEEDLIAYYKLEEDLDRLRNVGEGFGSSTTSRRRIGIAYYKSEEDSDRLLQVGEGLANIHRKVPISPDYSDFINNANLGRGAPGIGRAQILQATRLSPPFFAYDLVGWAWV